jgi:putative transport protein
MKELFLGQGVAHTILLLAFVIGTGIYLGRFKVKGVSIGATWILFMGIIVSHFGFRADPDMLHFIKEFGLILFVFSIGLQVGPGFFHSLKSGGLKMNLLALVNVLLAVAVTWCISVVTGVDLKTMVGVMSGAVTNTPGLGAAQQTYIDVASAGGMDPVAASKAASELASGYAVAYPIGIIGVILVLLVGKNLFRIDTAKELAQLEAAEDSGSQARRMHLAVENPAIFGKKLSEVIHEFGGDFIVSRVMKGDDIVFATGDTVLEEGDKVLVVTSQEEVDKLRIIFGEEVPMHLEDWDQRDHQFVTRRLTVTKSSLTGKKLKDLHFREAFGVNVTRVIRSGVELVARPDLYIQMGDALICLGPEVNIQRLGERVGNSSGDLNRPNLVPIFLGIVVGIIFGSLPIRFPGIPQPIKLGLAGGPLIIAILLGHFGPKHKITTYTTLSANLMVREIGISLFLAAVGLGAGENFVSSIVNGGYWWILYGALITIVPVFLTFVIARFLVRLNFYQICGLISGSCCNPPALAFAQGMYGSDYSSVNYATVYPLSMFLRVLVAQVLILISFA